ncbi:hypothetical protein P4O66_008191, partial [Electrophorus voltai]
SAQSRHLLDPSSGRKGFGYEQQCQHVLRQAHDMVRGGRNGLLCVAEACPQWAWEQDSGPRQTMLQPPCPGVSNQGLLPLPPLTWQECGVSVGSHAPSVEQVWAGYGHWSHFSTTTGRGEDIRSLGPGPCRFLPAVCRSRRETERFSQCVDLTRLTSITGAVFNSSANIAPDLLQRFYVNQTTTIASLDEALNSKSPANTSLLSHSSGDEDFQGVKPSGVNAFQPSWREQSGRKLYAGFSLSHIARAGSAEENSTRPGAEVRDSSAGAESEWLRPHCRREGALFVFCHRSSIARLIYRPCTSVLSHPLPPLMNTCSWRSPDHDGMAVSGLARAGTAQPWLLACFLLFMPLLMGLNPSASTQQKSNSFRRQFLGLDKCSVCVGTSICKKLLKEEIRFEKWLPPRLPPADRTSYEGTYTDDSESWRPVVLSRLVPPHLQELADRSICRSAGRKACSIEAVLGATPRFQSWARSNLLQPGMVQGLATPMLRCPSQRLLDRIVRRYFEVADVGSAQMKHFASKDKLRLLYTLAVSQQPLIQQCSSLVCEREQMVNAYKQLPSNLRCFLATPHVHSRGMTQMFPGTEGWPFPRYHGSCGRLVVWAASRPLTGLYASPLVRRADAAYQLLHTTQSLASNSLRFNLYYTRVSPTTFGITEDGRLSITDASNIGIIDLQDGFSNEDPQANHTDVFSCLSGSCERPGPCTSVRLSQSFTLLCRHVLPELLLPGDVRPGGLPARAIAELAVCADPKHSDQRILKAVHILKKALQPFRPCNISYGYRYPECRYSDEF